MQVAKGDDDFLKFEDEQSEVIDLEAGQLNPNLFDCGICLETYDLSTDQVIMLD